MIDRRHPPPPGSGSNAAIEPLDPELARLFEDDRAVDVMPRDLPARLWDKLEGTLPPDGGEPGGGDGGPTSPGPAAAPPAPSPTSIAGWSPLATHALALVLGGVGGAAIHAITVAPEPALVAVPARRDAIEEVAVVAPPLPSPAEVPAIAAPDHETLPTSDETVEPIRRPPSRSDTPRLREVEPVTEAPARASTLAAERVALEIARTAIGRGAYDNAIDALASHEREHPRSAVAEEREVLWIRALAGAGRGAEASARAAAFRRRYPDSLFLAAIEHVGAP